MGWFRKQDDLNRSLAWVGIGCLLVAFVFGGNRTITTLFRLVFALCVLWFLFRAFSSQPQKRNQENMAYLRIRTDIVEWFRNLGKKSRAAGSTVTDKWNQWQTHWQERKQYRYLTCKQCGQKLRVPRGKGKIRVTCTKCRNQFLAKS